MSARYGCHNRAPFREFYAVQDGWYLDGTRLNATRTPRMKTTPFVLARDCQYTLSDLGRQDPKCEGCKWKQEETPA